MSERLLIILDRTLKDDAGHSAKYDLKVADDAVGIYRDVYIYGHPVAEKKLRNERIRILAFPWLYLFFESYSNSISKNITQTAVGPRKRSVLYLLFRYVVRILALVISYQKAISSESDCDILIQNAEFEDIVACWLVSIKMISNIPRFVLVLRYPVSDIIKGSIERYIFKNSVSSPYLDWAVDSIQLRRQWSSVINKKIILLPVPILTPVTNRNKSIHDNFEISILGPSRLDKGFGILPNILEEIVSLKLEARTRIIFNIQYFRPDFQGADKIFRTINEISDQAINIEFKVYTEALTNSRYEELLVGSHATLLPYIGERYKYSTSSVFMESLAALVPVITFKNTWAGSIIQAANREGYLVGEAADNINSIALGIKKVVNNYSQYKVGLMGYVSESAIKLSSNEIPVLLANRLH